MRRDGIWTLILAAGEGSRLRSLTVDATGTAVPKQFCSLGDGHTLLEDTLERAMALSTPERICVVVAARHRRWWMAPLRSLPDDNVIVQPDNRGTAFGILLPLLAILRRDPEARVVLLPSDHFFRDETIVIEALRQAGKHVAREPRSVVLLGMPPDEADPELGYIVPAAWEDSGLRTVAHFVEKPAVSAAKDLVGSGALWNSFMMAGHAGALLQPFLERYPELTTEFMRAVETGLPAALVDLYQRLPVLDYSRHVLEGAEAGLRVLPVKPCGWSDLGTPRRVLATLRHMGPAQFRTARPAAGAISLMARARRLDPGDSSAVS